MKPLPPMVVAGAAAAVALLCLFTVMGYYGASVTLLKEQSDPYRMRYQKPRFAEVAEELPMDAVVGYVSNLSIDDPRGEVAFFGARYAVAPRLMVPHNSEATEEFVVGNFSADTQVQLEVARLATEGGLELVRDFGAGVLLFRKAGASE